jgi:hypothetical protein
VKKTFHLSQLICNSQVCKVIFLCNYAGENKHQILFKTWEDSHRSTQNGERFRQGCGTLKMIQGMGTHCSKFGSSPETGGHRPSNVSKTDRG